MLPPPPPLKLPLEPRRLGLGAIVAIVVHVLVLFAILWERSTFLDATIGDRGPRGGGGTGQESMRFFALPASAPPAAVPVPPVQPTPVPVATEVKPLEIERMKLEPQPVPIVGSTMSGTGTGSPGTGGGAGGGSGPGLGTSTGPGTGGDGGYILPADPRGVILPADCARGRFTVRFWVEDDGRVSRVEVDPPPKESDCRHELLAKMREYSFRPARTRDGRPVASIFPVTFER